METTVVEMETKSPRKRKIKQNKVYHEKDTGRNKEQKTLKKEFDGFGLDPGVTRKVEGIATKGSIKKK